MWGKKVNPASLSLAAVRLAGSRPVMRTILPSSNGRTSNRKGNEVSLFFDWNEENTRKLISLFEQNLSYKEIGNHFGLTRNAISGRINRLFLKGDLSLTRKKIGSPQETEPRNYPDNRKLVEKLQEPIPLVPVLPPKPILVLPPIRQEVEEGILLTDTQTYMFECRYPVSQQVSAKMRVCGKITHNGSSWCQEHSQWVWKPRAPKATPNPIKMRVLT
jgi:hypothetical protein